MAPIYSIRCLIEGFWAILVFFFSMLLLVSITKYFCGEGKSKISGWIKLFALMTIYCNTATELLMSIGLIYSSTVKYVELDNNIYKITHGISIVTYSIAQTTVYLFFTHRCQSSFKDTVYASSQRTYIILYILIISYIVTQISFLLFAKLIDVSDYFIIGTITSGIVFIIDLICSISMLALFVNTTFRIIVMNKSPSYDRSKKSQIVHLQSNMNNNNNNNHPTKPPIFRTEISESRWDPSMLDRRNSFIDTAHLNERQKSLLYINIKITVLSLCIMISYQIYIFICWSYNILGINYKEWLISKPVEDRFFYTNLTYWMIDCIIGNLCVYLNFKKTDPLYWIICSKCHLRFNICCEKIAHQKIRQNFNVEKVEHLEIQNVSS